MSRRALDAHNGGDCGLSCWYCDVEDAREAPVTRTSDGVEIPLPEDDDEEEVDA